MRMWATFASCLPSKLLDDEMSALILLIGDIIKMVRQTDRV